MMAEAIDQSKAKGEYLGAIPEESAVSGSQSNDSAEGRAANRRVELVLHEPEPSDAP